MTLLPTNYHLADPPVVVTRRVIERFLHRLQNLTPAYLKYVAGGDRAWEAFQEVRKFLPLLEAWSERLAEEERARIEQTRAPFAASLEQAVAAAVGGMRKLGVEPASDQLNDVLAAWPRILDVVEADSRERTLLDGAQPFEREIRAAGRTPNPPATSPVRDVAVQIRRHLAEAERWNAECRGHDERIASVDPYELDEREARWFAQFGLVPRNNGSGRPGLEPWVIPALEAAGLSLYEDPGDEGAE